MEEYGRSYNHSNSTQHEFVLSSLAYTPPLGRKPRNGLEEILEVQIKKLNKMWMQRCLQGWKESQKEVLRGLDTAMEDALVLARTSSKVTIVHRRDDFHRASFVLSEKVKKNSKINILWNSVVKEFVSEVQAESGKNVLTKVRIETTSGGDGGTVVAGGVDCKGAFVAIGHDPNTKFLKDLLEMDSNGYLETHGTKTSVEGIFAAGDVADHVYRQAITSAGSGAMAALDVEKYLSA